MELLIGRNVQGENTRKINDERKIVSSTHCRVWLDEATNTYYIEDLGSLNGTYVNGVLIKRMAIKPTDQILLGGPGGYETSLEALLTPEVGHSIEHLRKVYDDYHRDIAKLKSRAQLYGYIRIFPTLVMSLVSGVALFRFNEFVLGIISLVILLLFVIVSSILIRKTDDKMRARSTRFQLSYVCPNTNRFYGDKSWEVLKNERTCIYCREHFTK